MKLKPTTAELKARAIRAREWRAFRRNFLYTQVVLAEALGISERSVQYIEHGKVTPGLETQRQFRILQLKHARRTAA